MSAFKNLTNKRYGRLIALRPSKYKPKTGKNINWLCRCDCGRFKIVRGSDLLNGATQSCSCFNKDRVTESNYKNLIGKRFGRLYVLHESKYKPRINGSVGWLCKCDCGNFKIVSSSCLIHGHTKSCGCLQRELAKIRMTTHGQSSTKEYICMSSRKRRELKKQYDSEYGVELEAALDEFFPACVICGMTRKEHYEKYTENLHHDHVLPLSKGNGLVPGNAVVLCRAHNDSKHARPLDKFPLEWQIKIIHAAEHFKCYWESMSQVPYLDHAEQLLLE